MKILTKKILELQKEDGIRQFNIPGVFSFKNSKIKKQENVLYKPSMIFITSGSKTIYLNDKSYNYGKGKFLLVSFTTPFVCEANIHGKDVFAGINISLNKEDLYSLIKELNYSEKPSKKNPDLEPGVMSLDINYKIYDALNRLLDCEKNPNEARILGPMIIKEIMFYAIQETGAKEFCDIVLNNKSLGTMENILEEINSNFKNDFSMEQLAKKAGMSVPTFFRKFKSFTGFSPNQYIKNFRLTLAKNLLLSNYSVKEAAYEVGYNSQFQFSREYKRFHGYSPVLEGK